MEQAIPSNWEERENLREKGQFWTPDWVADAMVQYVAKDTTLVFDPATGRGAFWAALQRQFPDCRFLGTDIDQEVLQDSIYQQAGCVVELRNFIKNPPTQRFNGIVANPPYVRHHRLDEHTKLQLRKMTAKVAGLSIDGRAGLHVYFLIQALGMLERGGRLAFIVPADTCEGKFANKLWTWVAENFRIECVATFAEEAAPFPKVDTNALIFFIRNQEPIENFTWVKVQKRGNALCQFVRNQFRPLSSQSAVHSVIRSLAEALEVGFSRPQNHAPSSRYRLSDFATVMRGIATGANEFFFLTSQQVSDLELPRRYFKKAIGRTRDVSGAVLTENDLEILDQSGRPTWLLALEEPFESLPKKIQSYLNSGEGLGLPKRALIGQRKPWYKQEKRPVPEMLFAYLGRRSTRFILNEAKIVPLHCLHCVYTYEKNSRQVKALWQALNHPDTLANLQFVSKSYGSGALKAEPQNLAKLPIPDHIVEKFGLLPRQTHSDKQMRLFQEPAAEYQAKN